MKPSQETRDPLDAGIAAVKAGNIQPMGWRCPCGGIHSPAALSCPNTLTTAPQQAWSIPTIVHREPCAFDGLTPGVYGLVCTCPRCTPRCT